MTGSSLPETTKTQLKKLIFVTRFPRALLFVLLSTVIIAACGSGGTVANSPNHTYAVIYNGNGNTGGSAPVDSTNYQQGQTVVVAGNTENLVLTNYSFSGWNTQADGSGTAYAQGQTFLIGPVNVTLYAQWTANPTYMVIYNGNGNTSGSIPNDSVAYTQGQTVAVLPNNGNLKKTGYIFAGWNTQVDGLGLTYIQWQTFTMGTTNVTLYARWIAAIGYAYVANNTSNTLSQYSVDVKGMLHLMNPATIPTELSPGSIAVNPSGTYVYVANGYTSKSVSQYKIGVDGSLTSMATATVAAGGPSNSITVDPLGKYVYVTSGSSNTISQYVITANGMLMPLNPATVATETWPTSVTVDPSGSYVYVCNNDSNSVSQYKISIDGSLVSLLTPTVPTGKGPRSISVDPSGRFAYIANWVDNTISQYTIGLDGSLQNRAMATLTVASILNPRSTAIDPSGKYLYVVNANNCVSQYTISTTGSLTPMISATVPTGNIPQSITIDASGKFAYVTNLGDDNVGQYTIGTSGELTPMDPATVVTLQHYPMSMITVVSH